MEKSKKICLDQNKKIMNQDTETEKESGQIFSVDDIIKNNLIENTMLQQAELSNINLYVCALNPWKAILQETGAILFHDRKILKLNKYIINKYNIPQPTNEINIIYINNLCDVYIYLSHKYNKLINMSYFGYMLNMTYNDIYCLLNSNTHDSNNIINGVNVNTIRINIYKRLKAEREENLKEKCFESPGAVGTIAIGNVENGWNLTPGQKAINTADNNILSLGQLPTLKAIGTAETPTDHGILSD